MFTASTTVTMVSSRANFESALVRGLFAFFIRVAVPCFLVLLVSKIYFTHGESLSDRKWLRDAGGLDNEVIVVSLLAESLYALQQVPTKGAADTAIMQLYHLCLFLN